MSDTQVLPGVHPVALGDGVHAFFTSAAGGVSPAPWSTAAAADGSDAGHGLNLGLNVSDDPARVAVNRARVARHLGAPVAYATQVHGATVLPLGGAERELWSAPEPPGTAGEGDALVTTEGRLGLGVLVADCVPVLLADPVARVVAVAHAGRKGVLSGVVLRALDAMVERGADLARVRAAVGPAVCGLCYEVPAAMRDEVAAAVPQTFATTRAGTPGLDLPAGVVAQLAERGVAAVRVDRCTLEDESLFSHRRATVSGTTTGRQAGIIALI